MELYRSGNSPLKVTAGKKITNRKHVMFKKGFRTETQRSMVMEFPVVYNQRFSNLFFSEEKSLDAAMKKEIFLASFDRLVILKNKTNGKMTHRLITFIPDIDYLRSKKNDISHNHINKLDADFSGYLVYKDWENDRPLYYLRYDNGKKTRYKSLKQTSGKRIATTGKMGLAKSGSVSPMTIICWTEYEEIWGESCVSTGPEGDEYEYCEPYLESMEEYEVCEDMGDGDPCEDYGDCDTGDPCTDYGDCGPEPEPEPEPEPSPCDQADLLESNTLFKNHMTILNGITSGNYEAAYTFEFSTSDYKYSQGNANEHRVAIPVTDPIDGYMHNHFSGGFSTFSMGDMASIHGLLTANKIKDLSEFTLGVVTDHNTSYILKIENPSAFTTFLNFNFNTAANYNFVEAQYEFLYDDFKILGYTDINARETALLHVLDGAGVMLFKGNANFDNWQGRGLNAAGTNSENKNCN